MADIGGGGRDDAGPHGAGGAGSAGDGGAPHTGTTIVACAYDGGVVLGADGRVSTGNYISNRASNKIMALSDRCYLLRSGSAADTQAVGDFVRLYAAQLEGERGFSTLPTVAALANLVSRVNYNNKAGLVGAMIVAGWDEKRGGQVFGCPIGGTLAPAPASSEGWATDGSGSTYIWGYLDASWRPGMTRAEAQAIVVEALSLAMARDGSSGGVVRLVTVDKGGAEETFLSGDAVPLYGDELLPPNAGGVLALKGVGGGVDAADMAAIVGTGGGGAGGGGGGGGGGAGMVVG